MENITIPKEKYERLLFIEKVFTKLSKIVLDSYKSKLIEPIIENFEKTGMYSKEFIDDLRDGLSQSSYAFRESPPKK